MRRNHADLPNCGGVVPKLPQRNGLYQQGAVGGSCRHPRFEDVAEGKMLPERLFLMEFSILMKQYQNLNLPLRQL